MALRNTILPINASQIKGLYNEIVFYNEPLLNDYLQLIKIELDELLDNLNNNKIFNIEI